MVGRTKIKCGFAGAIKTQQRKCSIYDADINGGRREAESGCNARRPGRKSAAIVQNARIAFAGENNLNCEFGVQPKVGSAGTAGMNGGEYARRLLAVIYSPGKGIGWRIKKAPAIRIDRRGFEAFDRVMPTRCLGSRHHQGKHRIHHLPNDGSGKRVCVQAIGKR